MLTDKQSLIGSGIVLMSFVLFGILGILDNMFISGPIVIGFIVIIINLFITKRIPEAEEKKRLEIEKASSEEINKKGLPFW